MQIRSFDFSRLSSTFPPNLAAALGLIGLVAVGLAPSPASAQSPTPVTSILNGGSDTALEVSYSGGLLAPGKLADLSNYSAPNDSIPAEGGGVRMMWYPEKAAFRAGGVGIIKDGTQWDASKVGPFSIAFGRDTKASGNIATAMGEGTTASARAATAMGEGTTASARAATAMGEGTTASGRAATAMGEGTTASGIASTAMGFNTTATADAATAIGTETTAENFDSFSMGVCNSANTSGDNTLFTVGNGSYNVSNQVCVTRSDALVLKKDGDLAVGPSDPKDLRLFVQDEKDNAGVKDNPSANMALFKNTSTGSKPDVMGLQAGPSSPGSGVAYLSFYDRTGTTVGQVEGNGSGGVSYSSEGADFAEELPVAQGAAKPESAELVGVRGGTISLNTEDADRIMIASTAPIMTGNATPDTKADDDRRVAVAFVGQVPAKVRGSVEMGDLIVASGKDDGTARAVAPSEYRRAEHGPIAGQAWSAKETAEVGEVTVAVGLGRSGAVAGRMETQRDRIDELEAENEALKTQQQEIKKRLAALEAERAPLAVAGWAGSGAGLLVAFLLGGLLGAGLLWRR